MKNIKFVAAAFLAQWVFSASAGTQEPLQNVEVSLTSSLVSLHKSLVEILSISSSEHNVSSFLIGYLESKDFTVDAEAVSKDRENIFAYTGNSRKTRILVTSHIDTVPPFWRYERHGDEIWGRGTVDAKGSVTSQILAMELLLESSQIREGDVALLFVVGEEKGSEGMRIVNDLGLSWETVIFGEPTELKLASGHKGGMGFIVAAKGKAGRSGYPELGKSATHMLIRALAALDDLSLPSSKKYGNITINVGRLEGGVAGYVIAEDASALVSLRISAGSLEEIKKLTENAIYNASPDVKLEFTLGTWPIEIDHDVEGFETAVMNYGTDIPSLKGDHKRYLYGPGTILVAHSDHEHLSIADLEKVVDGL